MYKEIENWYEPVDELGKHKLIIVAAAFSET